MVERKLVERMVLGNDTSTQNDTSIDFKIQIWNLSNGYTNKGQAGGGVSIQPRQILD
jgi:hypothetical protein